jgi:hypothetical protein
MLPGGNSARRRIRRSRRRSSAMRPTKPITIGSGRVAPIVLFGLSI